MPARERLGWFFWSGLLAVHLCDAAGSALAGEPPGASTPGRAEGASATDKPLVILQPPEPPPT